MATECPTGGGAHIRDTRHKGTIVSRVAHSVRPPHTAHSSVPFEVYEWLVSGTFHLIFSDHGCMWVPETLESKTVGKGVPPYRRLHSISDNWGQTSSIDASVSAGCFSRFRKGPCARALPTVQDTDRVPRWADEARRRLGQVPALCGWALSSWLAAECHPQSPADCWLCSKRVPAPNPARPRAARWVRAPSPSAEEERGGDAGTQRGLPGGRAGAGPRVPGSALLTAADTPTSPPATSGQAPVRPFPPPPFAQAGPVSFVCARSRYNLAFWTSCSNLPTGCVRTGMGALPHTGTPDALTKRAGQRRPRHRARWPSASRSRRRNLTRPVTQRHSPEYVQSDKSFQSPPLPPTNGLFYTR